MSSVGSGGRSVGIRGSGCSDDSGGCDHYSRLRHLRHHRQCPCHRRRRHGSSSVSDATGSNGGSTRRSIGVAGIRNRRSRKRREGSLASCRTSAKNRSTCLDGFRCLAAGGLSLASRLKAGKISAVPLCPKRSR